MLGNILTVLSFIHPICYILSPVILRYHPTQYVHSYINLQECQEYISPSSQLFLRKKRAHTKQSLFVNIIIGMRFIKGEEYI